MCQPEVDFGPRVGGRAALAELGDEPIAHRHRLVHPPGECQCLDEQRFCIGAQAGIIEQPGHAAERVDRGAQRPPAEC